MNCAPILLLGFNRPDLLRGLVEILAKVQPPRLYLAIDGPRLGRESEADACAASAAVFDNPGWPCKVEKLVRTENLGCRLAVTGAIDWFFSKEEEGIILEDDCWPDPSFLRFATELLDRYRDNERIGMISGDNYYGFISDTKASYRFTNQVFIWGWATWRRAWKLNESDPESFRKDGEAIIRQANLTRRSRILYSRFLADVLKTRSTWDVPWMLSLQRHGFLSVMPRCNLIANEGYGRAGGTHTNGFAYDQYLFAKKSSVEFPLVHPETVARDEAADRLHELRAFAWLPRVLTVVGLKLGSLGRGIARVMHSVERIWPSLFRV